MIHTKEEIQKALITGVEHLSKDVNRQEADRYRYALEGKWCTAEHLDHLGKGMAPVNKALSIPKLLLRFRFGRAKHKSRNFEELFVHYKKAQTGVVVPKGSPFGPSNDLSFSKEDTQKRLQQLASGLAKQLDGWSESQLDKYQVPHPLIGKLTIREILFFTIFHNEIHREIIQRDYGS
ncbi:DinB family protein [Chitinophagales bacterium]|nr:DinB family protein [Chitinophagales bacterium]